MTRHPRPGQPRGRSAALRCHGREPRQHADPTAGPAGSCLAGQSRY